MHDRPLSLAYTPLPPTPLPASAVCTTELGEAAIQQGEFDKRNVKLIGLSCNSASDHDAWAKDIAALRGVEPTFPIIADPKRETAAVLGMLVRACVRTRVCSSRRADGAAGRGEEAR